MSIEKHPALRVAAARFALINARGHMAESLTECGFDTLAAQLAAAVAPGRPAPTKAELALLAERAVELAFEMAEVRVCACGHLRDEHVGYLDCGCRAARPYAAGVPAIHSGADVTVRPEVSKYGGRHGHVAMPDEEGGVEVALDGEASLLHFEVGELELGLPARSGMAVAR